MKYWFVLFFGTLILGLTAYSFLFPSYMIDQLLGTDTPLITTRLLLVFVIGIYIIYSKVRTPQMQIFLRIAGAIMLGYGLAALFSPMLFGLTDEYIPLGDVFIWLEGGIVGMLLSLEVPSQKVTKRSNIKFLVSPFGSRRSLGHT